MDNKLQKIGSRIKEARLSRHMTQLQLAEAAGISLSFLSNIENGRQAMQILTLIDLADVLNVSTDWILRDISQVGNPLTSAIETELSTCTSKEREAILQLVQSMKQSLSKLKETND